MRILLLFLFICNLSFAQYWGGQEVSDADLAPWIPKSIKEYTGNYHFGESEGESDFHLFFVEDYIIAQVKSGSWEEDTGNWKSKHINLTNIKIDEKGNFTSDQHSGQFITYKTAAGNYYHGLKINNPWTSWIEGSLFEVGTKQELVLQEFYYGKYSKASYRKLTKEELKGKRGEELTIMRNEIYARYGYIFKKGGKMDAYFRSQKWYRAEHKNVSNFLSAIERSNIKILKEVEK